MLEQGVKTDYCDCEPEVVPFFEGLGYKPQFDFDHPIYGFGYVMRLNVNDLEHLVKVRSPLRRVLIKWLEGREKMAAPLAGSCPT
jgi:hypothetical protein